MKILRNLIIILSGMILSCSSVQDRNEVIISTDKLQYSKGERIKIKVINNSDSTIIYAKNIDCGYSFFELNDCIGNNVIYQQLCLWDHYQHQFTELKPNDTLIGYWYQGVYLDYKPQKASSGCYKVFFPYFITNEDKIPSTWNEEKRIVYSNEFELD